MRSRIRQRQRELALNKMMQAIEKADVVYRCNLLLIVPMSQGGKLVQ